MYEHSCQFVILLWLKNAREKLSLGRPFSILHRSICHIIVTEKCQGKVESRVTILDPTQETNMVAELRWVTWRVQTTPKMGNNKSFGKD